jgi:hypothetical protein
MSYRVPRLSSALLAASILRESGLAALAADLASASPRIEAASPARA